MKLSSSSLALDAAPIDERIPGPQRSPFQGLRASGREHWERFLQPPSRGATRMAPLKVGGTPSHLPSQR